MSDGSRFSSGQKEELYRKQAQARISKQTYTKARAPTCHAKQTSSQADVQTRQAKQTHSQLTKHKYKLTTLFIQVFYYHN